MKGKIRSKLEFVFFLKEIKTEVHICYVKTCKKVLLFSTQAWFNNQSIDFDNPSVIEKKKLPSFKNLTTMTP